MLHLSLIHIYPALRSNLSQALPEFLPQGSHLRGLSERESPVVWLRAPPSGTTGPSRGGRMSSTRNASVSLALALLIPTTLVAGSALMPPCQVTQYPLAQHEQAQPSDGPNLKHVRVFVEGDTSETVSYTHLDVYKRQG